MTPFLIALFGMMAFAGILDVWDRDLNSEDQLKENDDSPQAPGNVYDVDIELKDSYFDFPGFDPTKDTLVLETRTLDLDFSLNESGDILSVFYGDAVTQLSALWGSDGIGDSVVIRHIVSGDDGESTVDYLLKMSGEVNAGSNPVFVEFDDPVSQLSLVGFHGVLNLGDDVNSLELLGDFVLQSAPLSLEGDHPELGTAPELNLQGGDNEDLIRVIDLQGNVDLGDGNDSLEIQGGQIQVNLGEGDDRLDGESSNSANDVVVGLGGSGNDSVSGSSGNDYLDGGRDHDTVSGLTGDDTIIGGTGSDRLYGGFGHDTLVGSRGAQFLPPRSQTTFEDFSDRAGDSMFGGAGNDVLIMDQYDTAFGGMGGDDFTIYYDPAKARSAEIVDFDHTADSLKIVMKLSDELLIAWDGHRLDDGAFEITTRVEWSLIDASKSKYMLQVGGYDVAEVISDVPPAIGSVSIVGYAAI